MSVKYKPNGRTKSPYIKKIVHPTRNSTEQSHVDQYVEINLTRKLKLIFAVRSGCCDLFEFLSAVTAVARVTSIMRVIPATEQSIVSGSRNIDFRSPSLI